MCTIFLYDALNDNGGVPYNPAIPIDGYWTLEQSPVGYPVLVLVDGTHTINVTSNETVIESPNGIPYNPSVELGEFPTGLFVFRYHFGNGCEQTADLGINIVSAPCQAENFTANVCLSQGILNLFDFFQGECIPTEFGDFVAVNDLTGSGITLSADGDGTNDTINTDIAEAGIYILDYNYHPEEAYEDCDECFRTVQITIIISENPIAGTENDVVICS